MLHFRIRRSGRRIDKSADVGSMRGCLVAMPDQMETVLGEKILFLGKSNGLPWVVLWSWILRSGFISAVDTEDGAPRSSKIWSLNAETHRLSASRSCGFDSVWKINQGRGNTGINDSKVGTMKNLPEAYQKNGGKLNENIARVMKRLLAYMWRRYNGSQLCMIFADQSLLRRQSPLAARWYIDH